MGIATAVALAACTPTELNGYLPGFEDADAKPATNHTEMVSGLWVNSWIVLLIVGVITWALMGFAAVAYRRRKGQSGLPVQMRYNMPVEIFYTILETQYEDPDVCVTAIGKQWAWDFQYNESDCEEDEAAVWSMGIQAQTDVQGNIISDLPTLYLPVDKEVKIKLTSRDVIHSFWIIDFLFKQDMYIGKDNYWSFTPTRVGEYDGKCAELCGQYHSMMLFKVKVVEQPEYDAYLETLRDAGQTGGINDAYDRLQNLPGTGAHSEGEN